MKAFASLVVLAGVGLAPSLRGETGPAITRGPYLQGLAGDQVRILWRTDRPSLGRAVLRSEAGEELHAAGDSPAVEHELTFAGLAPSTRYRYEVLDGDRLLASGEGLRFRSAPAGGEGVLRAAVIGDSGWGGLDQHQVTALLESWDFDLFLHTGDLIYAGTLDEVVFAEYRTILARSCLYPARGNHNPIEFDDWHAAFSPPPPDLSLPACIPPLFDCGGEPPAPARRPVFYSFDWGTAHITVADSNADFDRCRAQLDWLCRDLAAARARGVGWLLLMLHEHPYTTGSNTAGRARELIPPLADRFAVDLVLAGHEHNYQRSHPVRGHTASRVDERSFHFRPEGTIYIVTGGGGGLPYPIFDTAADHDLFAVFEMAYHAVRLDVSPDWLEARAVRADGSLLDHLIVSKTHDSPEVPFVWGDVNFDGDVNITDAIRILQHLFAARSIPCSAVADTGGRSGEPVRIDLGDAVFLLQYLFRGGADPAAPFPECGTAPEVERFTCRCACRKGCEKP